MRPACSSAPPAPRWTTAASGGTSRRRGWKPCPARLKGKAMAAAQSNFDPAAAGRGDPLETPPLACGVMAASKPYVAAAAHQKTLGFPGELVENWQDKAIARLGELLEESRALRRLQRQVPLFPGDRRSEQHAGGAAESASQGLSTLFHSERQAISLAGRGRGPDQGGAR